MSNKAAYHYQKAPSLDLAQHYQEPPFPGSCETFPPRLVARWLALLCAGIGGISLTADRRHSQSGDYMKTNNITKT